MPCTTVKPVSVERRQCTRAKALQKLFPTLSTVSVGAPFVAGMCTGLACLSVQPTMPTKRVLSPESVWDTAAVLQACAVSGVKPLHANRLWSHLIRHPEASFADVPDLPKAFLSVLQDKFTCSSSTVQEAKRSDDGDTVKLLVTLQDGMQVRCTQGGGGRCWRGAGGQQRRPTWRSCTIKPA